jgi:predicted MFS family arabinose efflux permease
VNAPTTGEPPPSQPPPRGTRGEGPARLLRGPGGGTLALLAAVSLAGNLDRYVVAALFESLRADLWLTDARLGLLATGFALASVLASRPFAHHGERRDRPSLLALGAAALGAATVLSGLARGFWTLLATRAVAGAGHAAPGAITPGLLADRFAPDRRGRAYALFFAAAPLGAALGYAAGGLLDRTLGWRAAFFAAGAPALALAVACLRLREPPRRADGWSRPVEAEGFAAGWRRLASNRPYGHALAGYAAHAFAVAALSWWLPAFLERARGVPRVVATVELGAIVGLTGLLGAFAGSHVADALRRRLREADLWVCGISALAAAPLALAALTAWRPGLYLGALVLAQLLLFASVGPVSAALAARVAPAERAGAVAFSVLAVQLLGEIPAPWLVGLASDHASLARAVLVVPAAILCAGAVWTWAAWQGEREHQET